MMFIFKIAKRAQFQLPLKITTRNCHQQPTFCLMAKLKWTTLLLRKMAQHKDAKHMRLTDKHTTCYIKKLLKTSRPGKHFGRLEFCSFAEDKPLCLVTVLNEYVTCTKLTRKCNSQLLLSYCKPFNPVSTDTIARSLRIFFSRECWH